MKEIELTLKQRIERFYRAAVGETWWDQLPAGVHRNARNRRRWAMEQIGRRRVLGETNIAWLSFGDIVRVLADLSKPEWQRCLDAEGQRQRHFEHALRRVKAFRDYHLAHPKPRPISTSELAAVCSSVERFPEIITPTEWADATHLFELIAAAPLQDRKLLNRLAEGYPEPDEEGLKQWLACPVLDNPCTCGLPIGYRNGPQLGELASSRTVAAWIPPGICSSGWSEGEHRARDDSATSEEGERDVLGRGPHSSLAAVEATPGGSLPHSRLQSCLTRSRPPAWIVPRTGLPGH